MTRRTQAETKVRLLVLDESQRAERACKGHLDDLLRKHLRGFGELNFAPCDIARAVANTRRLMRGVRNDRASGFTSTAGLCEEAL
jgi:hypothetical protein